jgi:hypothetical protein
MLEKIAIGKLNKFYQENTLLNQDCSRSAATETAVLGSSGSGAAGRPERLARWQHRTFSPGSLRKVEPGRFGSADKVGRPRKGRQARGSQANLFAGKTLKGNRRPSVRTVDRAHERIGHWDGRRRGGGTP